jgi:hypothetical protein
MKPHPETPVADADARIAWVLDHPHVSDWLKHAIRTSEGLDPITLQNEIEILRQLIRFRAHAQSEVLATPVPLGAS